MAGDWIKMRHDLPDDPSVIRVCAAVNQTSATVIGMLHRLWSWADRHTTNGRAPGVDQKWVDVFVGQRGFAAAMVAAGWLGFEGEEIVFPHFERHNGKPAKMRADAQLRQRVSRERHNSVTNGGDKRVPIPRPFVRYVFNRDAYTCVYCGAESSREIEASNRRRLSVDHILPFSRYGKQAVEDLATCCRQCNSEKNDRTPEEWDLLPEFLSEGLEYKDGQIIKRHDFVTNNRDKSVTREEKRREENTDIPCGVPPRGEGDADSKPRQRNPLWDAIADGYFGGKVAPPDESRVGKLVRDLKALGAEPSEIPARRRKIRQRWKESADTPESLVKHWAELGPQIQPLATASTDAEEAARAERRAREQAERAALAARLDRLDDLDHDTLEALKAKAVSAAPNDFTRRAFAAADPRTNRPLRVAMLTHVQETVNA